MGRGFSATAQLRYLFCLLVVAAAPAVRRAPQAACAPRCSRHVAVSRAVSPKLCYNAPWLPMVQGEWTRPRSQAAAASHPALGLSLRTQGDGLAAAECGWGGRSRISVQSTTTTVVKTTSGSGRGLSLLSSCGGAARGASMKQRRSLREGASAHLAPTWPFGALPPRSTCGSAWGNIRQAVAYCRSRRA